MLLYYCLYILIPKTMELTMMIKIPVGKSCPDAIHSKLLLISCFYLLQKIHIECYHVPVMKNFQGEQL